MRRLMVGLTLALALVTPPAAARQAVALVNPPAAQHAIGLMNPRVLAPAASDFPKGADILVKHVDTTAADVNTDDVLFVQPAVQGNRYQQLHFGGSLFEKAELPDFHGKGRYLYLLATIFPSSADAAKASVSDAAAIPQRCAPQPLPVPKQVRTTTCAYIDRSRTVSGMYVIATIGNVEVIVLGAVGLASPEARDRGVRDASFLALHEAQHVISIISGPSATPRRWQPQHNPYPGQNLYGIACPGAKTCYAVGFLILATTNGGVSWHAQAGFTGSGLLSVACPSVSVCLAVGFAGVIVATTDGGATWAAQHSGTSRDLYGIACPSTTTCVAVGYNGTILTTADGGHTWISRRNPDSGTSHHFNGVACPSVTVCYAVGYSTLATTDGGQSWHTQVGSPFYYLSGIACPSVRTCFSVGNHGTIVATTDRGTTWDPRPSGTSDYLIGIACPSAQACTVVGDKGTILHTSDGGATWQAQGSGIGPKLWGVACTSLGASCYAVGYTGIILKRSVVLPPTISTFYMSTKAAYDVWAGQVGGPEGPPAPPRVDTFPTTLRGLAYYFEYSRGTRSTTFQVNVRDHTGALVVAGGSESILYAAGSAMYPFTHSFPPGTYTAHLRINGQPIRSTTFTVAPAVPLPTISTFYASTRAAYDGWARTNYAPLPRVSTFPAHTRDVAFYFEHSGGGTGSFSVQGYVRDHNGNIVVSGGVGYLSLTSGNATAGYLTAPLTSGYPPGTYTMSLLIDGQAVQKSAIFTVQPPAPAATPTSPPPAATSTPQAPPPAATSTPQPPPPAATSTPQAPPPAATPTPHA